ncbi:MAG TPA: DNA gyrase inhibitor YacG [Nitrospiria bacterium]
MKISCPICRAETHWEDNANRPFCSERCRLTDLGAWASDKYRLEQNLKPESSSSDAQTGHGQKNGN